MFCEQCGTQIGENKRFCQNCNYMFCERCGTKKEDDKRLCQNCSSIETFEALDYNDLKKMLYKKYENNIFFKMEIKYIELLHGRDISKKRIIKYLI